MVFLQQNNLAKLKLTMVYSEVGKTHRSVNTYGSLNNIIQLKLYMI